MYRLPKGEVRGLRTEGVRQRGLKGGRTETEWTGRSGGLEGRDAQERETIKEEGNMGKEGKNGKGKG